MLVLAIWRRFLVRQLEAKLSLPPAEQLEDVFVVFLTARATSISADKLSSARL